MKRPQTINKKDLNKMKEMLLALMEDKKIVLLFSNEEDTEAFSCGYIGAVSSGEVLIIHIDAFGEKDGYIVKRIEDIVKVEYDGQYSEKVGILDQLNKNKHEEEFKVQKDSLFLTMLAYAQGNMKIVSIEIKGSGNEDIAGYVETMEEDFVTIKVVDYYGLFDGEAIVEMSNITHLICDGGREATLNKLVQYRMK